MKLFNRQKAVTNIPPELQQYYQMTQPEHSTRRTIISIIIAVVVAAIVITAGVWAILHFSNKHSDKPSHSSQTKAPTPPANKLPKQVPVPLP